MTGTIESKATYPKEISRVSTHAVLTLEDQGYFNDQFEKVEEAKTLFFDRFSESLLSKFISGDDIEWEREEFEKVLFSASVEHAVYELECEGKLHRFDDVVVLAEPGF